MNINEFRALKRGDRIENVMTGSCGTVTGVDDYRGKIAVSVQWNGMSERASHAAGDWWFNEQSTAWMHWTLEN